MVRGDIRTTGNGACTDQARPDAALLAAHVAGDPDAFEELIRRHERHLWSLAVRTMGNPDDAADALQDALFSAHRNAHRFRGEAQVQSWLHRVTVNACLDRLRRSKIRPTVSLTDVEMDEHTDGRDQVNQLALRLDIGDALRELPPDQRAVVVALDVEGLSIAETAQRLGISPGTVKSRSSRGRAKLAVLLAHLRAA